MNQEQDSISIYLAQDCKVQKKRSEKTKKRITFFHGRWTKEQWLIYIEFFLQEFIKNRKIYSFTNTRRPYQSSDRRQVEFILQKYSIKKISKIEFDEMVKRVKSKYNTLKRNYENKKSSGQSSSQNPDFMPLIQRSAKQMAKVKGTNFNVLMTKYNKIKMSQRLNKDLSQPITFFDDQNQIFTSKRSLSHLNNKKKIGY